jgi:hypothetical protein
VARRKQGAEPPPATPVDLGPGWVERLPRPAAAEGGGGPRRRVFKEPSKPKADRMSARGNAESHASKRLDRLFSEPLDFDDDGEP